MNVVTSRVSTVIFICRIGIHHFAVYQRPSSPLHRARQTKPEVKKSTNSMIPSYTPE